MAGIVLNFSLKREDSSTPWGFRMEGGIDLGHSLNIQKVTPGGLAERVGLRAGDLVLRLNASDARFMTHEAAKMEIIRSSNDFVMTVERGGAYKPPMATSTVFQPVSPRPQYSSQPVSAIYKQTSRPQQSTPSQAISPGYTNLKSTLPNNFSNIGTTHNINPQPFGQMALPPGGSITATTTDGRVQRVAHNAYNTPMGLYSARNADAQFDSTLANAGINISPSAAKAVSINCVACGQPIKGVMVRVHKEIPMHPECLKCYRCGVGLRNIGYFYINQALYCDKHAKEACVDQKRGMKLFAVHK